MKVFYERIIIGWPLENDGYGMTGVFIHAQNRI